MLDNDIKQLILDGNETIEAVKGKQEQLEARLADVETKAGRPRAAGAAQQSDILIEAKKLRQFCETGEGLERKAINTATGSEGGFALPTQISGVIQDQLLNVSPIRQIARIVQVESSDYRHLVGTRGAGATWRSELGAGNPTNTPGMAEVIRRTANCLPFLKSALGRLMILLSIPRLGCR